MSELEKNDQKLNVLNFKLNNKWFKYRETNVKTLKANRNETLSIDLRIEKIVEIKKIR